MMRRRSSIAVADALSLEVPRYDRGADRGNLYFDDGLDVPARHRRVKSYNPQWTHLDPVSRDRAYTKSLGNLVKHLAPLSSENDCVSPAPSAMHSPRFGSPMDKLMGSLPKIWSPRSGNGVTTAPVVDYRIKYEFALILHNRPTTPRILARNGLDAVGKQQMEVIKRCITAGLEVAVLSSSLYSRKYMVLLLRPTPSRLQIEKSRLVLERWLQIGAVGEVPSEIEQLIASSHIGAAQSLGSKQPERFSDDGETAMLATDEDHKFTPAERIQTIARIITSTANIEHLNPPGADISIEDENNNDPVIASCFPLHNRRVNSILLAKCGQWWWKSNEITNELRYYYGERVAFYFSFVFLYTKCLLIPALCGSIVYFSCRWLGAVEYMRALCIFGFCAVTLWGTWFLKAWRRKNNLLNDAWNLRLFKEAEYPNSTFKPAGYRDVVDSYGVLLFREPYYHSVYRIPAYLQTFIVFTIFIVTYVLGITFFVQWYTAAMMAPLCTKCPDCVAFLSCFDTERPTLFSLRWGYILAQGVLLGISLDIFVYLLSVKLIHFFVVRENHATEAHFQRTMINRLFVINWISFFLWFILIAFVIVPFGEEVEAWLSENFKYKKLTVDWENGVIDMSTALVTPLLITQALNLLIDTALPYLFRRETLKASKLARKIMRANPAETLLALSEYQSSFENLQGDATQTPASSVDFKVKMELQIMTPIRIPYIEKSLGISISTLEGFENEKCLRLPPGFMTADDVLEESQLSLYNAFGYVVMFSVVWPFCALAALVNNLVHIRNCYNKLFLLRRRPVPRKSNSIGQWEKILFITLILAVFVVVGLICVSSGELEYFLTQCISLERFNGKDFSMNPDFNCVDLSSRFLVALVLEHAALLIVFLVFDNISDTPATVRTSFQRKKELIRRAICGHGKNIASVSSTPVSAHDFRSNSTSTTTASFTENV
uniref:Anoctamin transmembrane domain-containing protein n=1 Tax=Globisporangium ultimum (strain ATCC 200006 / CBS 805.95 / DAOM BR144) TaxID=431595 RepID=K3WKQ7_GLOUD